MNSKIKDKDRIVYLSEKSTSPEGDESSQSN